VLLFCIKKKSYYYSLGTGLVLIILAITALAILGKTGLLIPAGIFLVVVAAAVGVINVVIILKKGKIFCSSWVLTTIAAMSIVWYLFTPLFLVCSVTGILAGYLLGSFKKEQVLSDGPVK
jgi:hypothetical protein